MKKMLAILLSVVMTAALCSAAAAASADMPKTKDRELETVTDGILNIVIDGGTSIKEAQPGEEVDVKVELINNPGISSLKAIISWPEKLTLVKAEYNIYNEEDKSAMIYLPEDEDWSAVSGSFPFNWLSASNTVTGDVTFVTLTFRVSEDAEDGEFLPVEALIRPYNVFSGLNTEVEFTLINGGVDTFKYIIGDVNDDGAVNNKDVVALFRHVSGTTPKVFILKAADVNGDGAVNNKDVVALFRIVSSLS